MLDRLGITLLRVPGAGCCGAISYHTDAQQQGLDFMRRLIDAWWPRVEAGAEAVAVTASGCGALVKEYGHLLRHDARYAEKAARISALARDISEILAGENRAALKTAAPGYRAVAWHAPCTLQHAQKINGVVERLLQEAGYRLTPVPDAHLCCGSAGTYSLLQKDLSRRLRDNKLQALQSGAPDVIVTGNIGCLIHLQREARVPVRHWIELLDEVTAGAASPTGQQAALGP